jgi:hypothetical protein
MIAKKPRTIFEGVGSTFYTILAPLLDEPEIRTAKNFIPVEISWPQLSFVICHF